MTRDALIQALRKYARKKDFLFSVDTASGKGSHYRARLAEAVIIIQSGELDSFHVQRVCRQLGVDPADL